MEAFGPMFKTLCRLSCRRISKTRVLPALCSTANAHANLIGRSMSNSSQQPFSRFPIPTVESLPESAQQRIRDTEEKSGFIPSVFSALSYRPDDFDAFFNYYDVVMAERGSLSKADKEMIVVATSAENGCLYCIIAHGALHRIYSKNPLLADQLAANWKTADLDPRQRAILAFSIDLCHCRPITDQHVQDLSAHGLSMDDIWDVGFGYDVCDNKTLAKFDNQCHYIGPLEPELLPLNSVL